jgi:hypothetical protein
MMPNELIHEEKYIPEENPRSRSSTSSLDRVQFRRRGMRGCSAMRNNRTESYKGVPEEFRWILGGQLVEGKKG